MNKIVFIRIEINNDVVRIFYKKGLILDSYNFVVKYASKKLK